MEFKINQVIISKAVQTVSKIANSKAISKTQNGILMIAENDRLTLIACDGKNRIETAVNAVVQEEGKIVVPHNYLNDLLKKMMVEDIKFKTEESGNILITSGKSKYRIMGYSFEDFKLIEMDEEEYKVQLDADLFTKAVDQVKYAVSRDESRLILTGILLEFKNEKLNLVAIDGYRMTKKSLKITSQIEKNIVVTEKTISEVQRMIGAESSDSVFISISDKMIKFTIGSTVLISSLLNGEFLNYENIIPKEFKSEIYTEKELFSNAVDRSTVMISSSLSKVIKLKISDDNLQIDTESESGNAHEEITIKLEGEDQYIGFNPVFLLEALNATEGDRINIKFTSAKGPCVIFSAEHDDYFCLLLPCTI